MIIDATNLILGRLATRAAKKALLGEEVVVVNCEKAVVTGQKKRIIDKYLQTASRGNVNQGPYVSRRPDLLVRRTIRGMLPRKKPRGREAFARVKCFIGVPEVVKGRQGQHAQEFQTFADANVSKLRGSNYLSVMELCSLIGWKAKGKIA